MGQKYTFVAHNIDVDDANIDDEINTAVERYARRKGIEHWLITDYFNDDSGRGVRVNLEDVGE